MSKMWTLLGLVTGHYVPLVFSLLKDKSKETYLKMLQAINSLCLNQGYTLTSQVVHVDFEAAEIQNNTRILQVKLENGSPYSLGWPFCLQKM